MLYLFSGKIIKKIVECKSLSEEDSELYQYGLFLLFSQILYFSFSLIMGIFLKIVIESMVFFVAFQVIRQVSGGFHASTELRCYFLSSIAIASSLFLIKFTNNIDMILFLLMITILSSILIFVLAPLDSEGRKLSVNETKKLRVKSQITLLVILILIYVSLIQKWLIVCTPCCVSLILESVLLLAGKMQKIKRNMSEPKHII